MGKYIKRVLRAFLSQQQTQQLTDGFLQLAIAERQSDLLIGDVFFALKKNVVTLGITVCPNRQRQGYAYEILYCLIPQLCSEYLGSELVALIQP